MCTLLKLHHKEENEIRNELLTSSHATKISKISKCVLDCFVFSLLLTPLKHQEKLSQLCQLASVTQPVQTSRSGVSRY